MLFQVFVKAKASRVALYLYGGPYELGMSYASFDRLDDAAMKTWVKLHPQRAAQLRAANTIKHLAWKIYEPHHNSPDGSVAADPRIMEWLSRKWHHAVEHGQKQHLKNPKTRQEELEWHALRAKLESELLRLGPEFIMP